MEDIIMKISDITGISVNDILSRKKTREICEARQIFIYISSNTFGKSHKNIAIFINRTRQNVSSQIIDFDQQIRIYKGLKNKVKEIEGKILSC